MTDMDQVKSKELALVVDDSMTQCMILSVLLKEEGYRVEIANNGEEGVEKYIEHKPDLVLMDINMPVMNGYEASRRIKNLSGDNLAPLIFITSLDTEDSFIQSVDAGGDGILVRPFSPEVFKAKIKSIKRINILYQQVKNLQQVQQQDAQLAEKMISDVIESRNYALDKIGMIKQAAAMFSGDIQLTSLCPNGDIHVLLGDFTGHGLRASIGVIPVAETFRAMTKKGFSLIDIISQTNRQLYNLLPNDLFFAACFVCISTHHKSAYIFNAGLPDGYIFNENAEIKQQFPSIHPPLGILTKLLSDCHLVVVPIEERDRVVLISDGIIEARNEQGHEFGVSQFEQAAREGINNSDIVTQVLNSLQEFCKGMPQEDDISLIDVPCFDWQQAPEINQIIIPDSYTFDDDFYETSPSWSWHLHLSEKSLTTVNPIPLIMNQVNDIEGAGEHWHSLYTVLTELYMNALDHGVLGMSSTLKHSPEGFSQYYNERTKRLGKLDQGFVSLELNYFPYAHGGKMVINVKDSGKGFDVLAVLKKNRGAQSREEQLSGRGLELINQLCDTLDYQDNGTCVTASYVWCNN